MEGETFSREDTRCLKAVAILLMILHHSPNGGDEATLTAAGRQLYLALAGAGKLCVGLFALLAGYGLWMRISEKGDTPKQWSDCIGGRILGVYRKYWLSFLAFVPFMMLKREWHPGLREWMKNLFCIDPTLNRETWFLRFFVLCCLTAPLLYHLPERIRGGGRSGRTCCWWPCGTSWPGISSWPVCAPCRCFQTISRPTPRSGCANTGCIRLSF